MSPRERDGNGSSGRKPAPPKNNPKQGNSRGSNSTASQSTQGSYQVKTRSYNHESEQHTDSDSTCDSDNVCRRAQQEEFAPSGFFADQRRAQMLAAAGNNKVTNARASCATNEKQISPDSDLEAETREGHDEDLNKPLDQSTWTERQRRQEERKEAKRTAREAANNASDAEIDRIFSSDGSDTDSTSSRLRKRGKKNTRRHKTHKPKDDSDLSDDLNKKAQNRGLKRKHMTVTQAYSCAVNDTYHRDKDTVLAITTDGMYLSK
jgi:hypothetical protein